MKQIVRRVGELSTGLLLASFSATHAFAAINADAPSVSVNSSLGTGNEVITSIFRIITTISVILFVILLLIGGIQYLGSFGNEDGTTKAKKLMLDAVVGLFIVLAAAGIASFVFQQLGVTSVGINIQ